MLKSKRIALAPLTSRDLVTLHGWINDREQVLYNGPYRPVHEAQHAQWFEDIQRARDAVIFGIRTLEADRLIGTCQLHSIHAIHRHAELQIRVGRPEDRGQGYGTEATRLLVDFAFKDLNLHRVQLHVRADNLPAVRVYEKSGFVREGLLRQAAFINGGYVDLLVMAIVRDACA